MNNPILIPMTVSSDQVTYEMSVGENQQTFSMSCEASIGYIRGRLQEKEAVPSEQTQDILPDADYDALSKVTVDAIPSDYVGSDVPRQTTLTATGNTVTASAGYYENNVTQAVQSGIATVSGNITADPFISVDSSGLITATVSASEPLTPTVNEGYVTQGTPGTVNVNGSETRQLPTRTYADLSVNGATVTAPSGWYADNASKTVASGTEGTPTATKGTVSNHSVSVTPSVTNTGGYISGGTHSGTPVTVTASELVSGTRTISANGTGIDVTNYQKVNVAVPGPSLQTKTKTYTPTTTIQTETVQADAGYDGLDEVNVTINAMPSGTAGTPTATKGTVSNHSVSVSPKVTNTTGYITGGTITGTAVTVSASELVSGSQTLSNNGTYNVTNLAEVVVDMQGMDCPTFTVRWDEDFRDIQTVTCDKTYAECVAYVSGGTTYSLVIDTNIYDEDPFTYIGADGRNEQSEVIYTACADGGIPFYDVVYNSNGTLTWNIPSASLDTLQVTSNGSYGPSPGHAFVAVDVSVPAPVPTLQTKSVAYVPGASQQTETVTPDGGYDGLDQVNVTVYPIATETVSRVYTPTESQQTEIITPSSGYDAIGNANITVNAISSTYVGSGVTRRSSTDLTAAGATVTAPSGYYSASASKAIASGSARPAASISGTTATVTTGTNTITLSKTVSNTPQVTAGYVGSGTAGNSSVSLTANVTTKAASTIYPSTSDQTIASSTYLTGTQTIHGVSQTNLSAENIKNGTTISINNGNGNIWSVTGTYEGGGGGASNIVEGTFTTPSSAGASSVNIPYTGSGYPISCIVVVEGGAYVSGTSWYSSMQRYAVGQWTMTKSVFSSSPTYGTSGSQNQGVTTWIYKNSTSSSTSYSRSSAMNTNVFSSSNASNAGATCIRLKSGNVLSYYTNTSSYGLLPSTTYRYIITYSS